ncbi:MAG TPA: hypothetical protein VGD56_08265, partial [Gemmatirosa sp.]
MRVAVRTFQIGPALAACTFAACAITACALTACGIRGGHARDTARDLGASVAGCAAAVADGVRPLADARGERFEGKVTRSTAAC